MTAQDYKPFLDRMIQRYEGGYGWDRNDPGGPTKYGITCWDLAAHRHQRMDSMAHWAPIVKAMSMQEAEDIYANKYATATAFVDLNAGCDCVVFDFGVNSGPSRSVRCAQNLVGVTLDGVMGPVTIKAINAMDATAFVNGLCNTRMTFLRSLHTWGTFGDGWSARVRDLRLYALALIHPPLRSPIYEDKEHLIPMAFGKAWAAETMPK